MLDERAEPRRRPARGAEHKPRAASDEPSLRTAGGLDINLNAKMRDNQAFLLGAEITAEQAFFGKISAPAGAYAALVLDFFNAPVLASGQVSFGHELHVLGTSRSVACRGILSSLHT